MKNTEWLTTKEALSLLKITSYNTLRRFAREYNVRISKPMGKNYYNLPDIISAIDERSV